MENSVLDAFVDLCTRLNGVRTQEDAFELQSGSGVVKIQLTNETLVVEFPPSWLRNLRQVRASQGWVESILGNKANFTQSETGFSCLLPGAFDEILFVLTALGWLYNGTEAGHPFFALLAQLDEVELFAPLPPYPDSTPNTPISAIPQNPMPNNGFENLGYGEQQNFLQPTMPNNGFENLGYGEQQNFQQPTMPNNGFENLGYGGQQNFQQNNYNPTTVPPQNYGMQNQQPYPAQLVQPAPRPAFAGPQPYVPDPNSPMSGPSDLYLIHPGYTKNRLLQILTIIVSITLIDAEELVKNAPCLLIPNIDATQAHGYAELIHRAGGCARVLRAGEQLVLKNR